MCWHRRKLKGICHGKSLAKRRLSSHELLDSLVEYRRFGYFSCDATGHSECGVWVFCVAAHIRRTRTAMSINCGTRQRKKYAPHMPLPDASPPSGPSAGPNAPIPAPTKLMKHTMADMRIAAVLPRIMAAKIRIRFAIISPTIRHPNTMPRWDVWYSIFYVVQRLYSAAGRKR